MGAQAAFVRRPLQYAAAFVSCPLAILSTVPDAYYMRTCYHLFLYISSLISYYRYFGRVETGPIARVQVYVCDVIGRELRNSREVWPPSGDVICTN